MNKIQTCIMAFCLLWTAAMAQSDEEKVAATTSLGLIEAHMGFLASDALKGRDVNTDGGMAAAEYIRSHMVRFGVRKAPGMDSYFQAVKLKKVSNPKGGSIQVAGKELSYAKDFLMIEGDNRKVEGRYFFVGQGTQAELEAIGKKKLEGKILVAICGDGEDSTPAGWFTIAPEKRKIAREMGAVGLVEIYQNVQLPWSILINYVRQSNDGQLVLDDGEEGNDGFLHLWMSTEDKELVKELRSGKGKRKQSMALEVNGIKREEFQSPNVVGYLEGTDPELKNEYVIYCAHYDHVGVGQANSEGDTIFNGARDNAIGTTGILSAMEHFARYPTRRSALFISFTAEEKGLLGSKWYAKYPAIPLKQMAFCFNIDNAGYNDTSIVTVFGLGRTTAGPHLVNASKAFGLRAIDDPAPEQNLFDRSDNVSFAEKGIPAPTFSMGFTAFDETIFKYYHQASDEVESMDMEYLLKYVQSYLLAGRYIANDDLRPFWTEGDKYYDAGLELYDRKP